MAKITRSQVNQLVGKEIKAMRKDGSIVSGKLVRIQGNRLIVEPAKGKKVQTKAIIPLVLFDLLAVGTIDDGFGWGGGYDGYGYGGGYGGWW
ncbi:hypothetical protein [Cohnella soli]|uniref:50S ribosomal protein L33 n=1 Tax=Cohnella soli TaxID=425005 RepID=A0ABW0HM37_9BACL